jgi:hypothetical protein
MRSSSSTPNARPARRVLNGATMATKRIHTSLSLLALVTLAACGGGEIEGATNVSGSTGGAPGTGGTVGKSGAGGTAGKGGAAGGGGAVGGKGGATGGTAGMAGMAGAPGGSGGSGGSAGGLGLDAAPAAKTLGMATFAQAIDVVIPAGPFAFGVQTGGGVAVLDLLDPAAAKTASTIATPGKVVAIEYDDANGFAYLLDAGGVLTVARIFTAESPQIVATKTGLPAMATGMARVGSSLFVAQGSSIVPVAIDTSGATPTFKAGALVSVGTVTALAGGGSLLFVGHASGTVDAWSATGTPAKVGSFDFGGPLAGLVAKGSKVVGLASGKGMRVVDFGAPTKPVVLWQDAELYDAVAGQLHGRTLVVGLQRQYVSVLDLSDFTQPRAITTNKGTLPKWVSFVEGNLIFGSGTTATIAGVPPFVAARAPAPTLAAFPRWGAPPLTFNKRIDPATASSVTLSCNGAPVAGTTVVSPDRLTTTFRPSAALPAGIGCVLSYGGLRDALGNPASTSGGSTLAFTTGTDAPASFMQPHSTFPHTSDGAFTTWTPGSTKYEWFDVKPAKGMYTYFYADFDGSKLWLLNDWFYDGDDIEPDCYNQFQAWTGDGKEQWEIRAYGDKHVEVRKNGAVVDPKAAGVDGGFSYGASPNVASAHTMYELGIPASAGQWGVQLHDPGPAFQCKKLASEPTSVVGATGQQTTVDPTNVVTIPAVPQLTSPGSNASLTPTLSWSTAPDTWKNFDAYFVTVGSDPKLATGRWSYWSYGTSVTLPAGLLASASQYYWQVTAYNAAGQSISTTGTFTTGGGQGGAGGGGGAGGSGVGGQGGSGGSGQGGAGGSGTGQVCYSLNDAGVLQGSTTGTVPIAFQHIPAVDETVSGVELFTGGLLMATSNTIEVYSDSAGQPGTSLATGKFTPATGVGYQGVTLAAPVVLTAGTPYWIVWTPDSGEQTPFATTGTPVPYRGFVQGAWNGPFNANVRYRLDCSTGGAGGASGAGGAGGAGGVAGAGGAGGSGGGASGSGGSGGSGSFFCSMIAPAFSTVFDQASLAPNDPVVGDFNGDGKPDVLTGKSAASTYGAQLFLGNGTGALAAPTLVQTGLDATSPVTGDFNGDGKLDFAVLSQDHISVVLGNGDGTFILPAGNVGTGPGAQMIAIGDFNGDTKLDLVSSTAGAINLLRLHLGNGDGTFQAATTIAAVGPAAIAVGDVNGDGKVDVVSNNLGDVTLYKSNGDGTFQAPAFVGTAPAAAGRLLLGHFDTGATLDVLHVNGTATTLFTNNLALGTFDAPKTFTMPNGVSAFAGDIDGDGVDDLLAPAGNTMFVYRADGTGAFPGIYKKSSPMQTNASRGIAADLDGDGKLDAVMTDGTTGVVTTFINACQLEATRREERRPPRCQERQEVGLSLGGLGLLAARPFWGPLEGIRPRFLRDQAMVVGDQAMGLRDQATGVCEVPTGVYEVPMGVREVPMGLGYASTPCPASSPSPGSARSWTSSGRPRARRRPRRRSASSC